MSSELAGFPGKGRLYRDRVRVGIADADPERRCRLDAIARWLQDVAYADLADAGLEGAGEWVVRRNRIVVEPEVRAVMQEMKAFWREVVGGLLQGSEAASVYVIAGIEGLALERLDRGETPALKEARKLFVASASAALSERGSAS